MICSRTKQSSKKKNLYIFKQVCLVEIVMIALLICLLGKQSNKKMNLYILKQVCLVEIVMISEIITAYRG